MMGHVSWFGVVAGAVVVSAGAYAICRPASVGGWLERQGVPHAPPPAFLRQIKCLGLLFMLAGAFFVAVAARGH